MAEDITGSGLKVKIIAVPTFPAGIDITQFADDQDAINFGDQDIAETAMGLNGDLVVWGKPSAINITLSVIPDSEDDKNLGILYDMNRIAKNKVSARDMITMTVSYPGKDPKTYTNGKLIGGTPGNSVSSNARLQSKQYRFAFENKIN
ncbi:MAG: hypothetical protein J5706_07770 [Elusimicrobiales bacterium]|nr:hypothetical protein [Elusimicrobiales bacterium]